jgi:uncharacterized protein YbjT (DUF2867 family)
MKIVIIGGTGLIGSKVVRMLRDRGHDAVPAALETGVNTVTGAGLAAALSGATVVVDVSNSPSFDGEAAMQFFQTSTHNVLAAEAGPALGTTWRCRSSASIGSPKPGTSGPRSRRKS